MLESDMYRTAIASIQILLTSYLCFTTPVTTNTAWDAGVLAVSHRQPLPSQFSVNNRPPLPRTTAQSLAALPEWCSHNQGFTALQRGICSMSPVVASAALRGYRMALKFCAAEFSDHKWNCSLMGNAWESFSNHTEPSHFDDGVLPPGLLDTREAAFYYAITRAGIAHSITDVCTKQQAEGCWMGDVGIPKLNLLRAIRKSHNLIIPRLNRVYSKASIVKMAVSKDWQWGSENHNIEHGIKYSRKQLEYDFSGKHVARLSISDKLNLHNTNVGRRVYEKAVLLVCNCHGMSWSCTTRTCWRRQADFRKVSRELKNTFLAAKRVQRQRSGNALGADKNLYYGSKKQRKLAKGQLGFTRKTPNLCQRNQRLGILGTRGRPCTNMSEAACRRLCCNRAVTNRLVRVQTKCGCEFNWCCNVTCSTCERYSLLYICKR